MKVGILGPAGTFSEFAAKAYFAGQDVSFALLPSISELIEKTDAGLYDGAFVPIENSIEGAVNTTMDCLAAENNLYIYDEFPFPIHECLMAKGEGISRVVSHPQPLGQCSGYLKQHPHWSVSTCESTAAGAKIACQDEKTGVIGPKGLAPLYGLRVLEENIEDNSSNSTRFVLLTRQMHPPTGQDKTSIVLSILDRPGTLIKALSVIDLFDLNMSRIESRPAKTHLGEYLFFIDIDGHITQKDVSDALDVLKKKASRLKFLGSYPKQQGQDSGAAETGNPLGKGL